MKSKIEKSAFIVKLTAVLVVLMISISCNKELADRKDFANNTGGNVIDAQQQKYCTLL